MKFFQTKKEAKRSRSTSRSHRLFSLICLNIFYRRLKIFTSEITNCIFLHAIEVFIIPFSFLPLCMAAKALSLECNETNAWISRILRNMKFLLKKIEMQSDNEMYCCAYGLMDMMAHTTYQMLKLLLPAVGLFFSRPPIVCWWIIVWLIDVLRWTLSRRTN